jgi:hypothetical protein
MDETRHHPKVIPNKHAIDATTQYEVDFGQQLRAILYQNELRLVKATTATSDPSEPATDFI